MKAEKAIFCMALALMLAASCGKEDSEKNSQESYIAAIAQSYANSDSTVTVTYLNGSTKVTLVHGSGDSLAANGTVSFYYAAFALTSSSLSLSNLFATNNAEIAESASWNLSDTTVFSPMTVDLDSDDLVNGLKNGLVGVQAGEECLIMFNQDHAFSSDHYLNVPKNTALAYRLQILEVANNH